MDPEWHEAMINAIIDIFEMSYEESVSYFKLLENLLKIRFTNGSNPSSLPVDNKITVSVTIIFGKSFLNSKGSTCSARKSLALKPKLDPKRSLWLSILKKLMHSKGSCG
jgi:hypothetical protein